MSGATSLIKRKIRENKSIRTCIKSIFSCVFRILPIENNKVVFDNCLGGGYGENPKYIAEELRSKKQVKLIWLANDINGAFPQGIIPVNRYSIRAFYECATAKAWVFNTRHGKLTKKRKQQVLLQTWHGSLAIKRVEKDAENVLSPEYVLAAKEDGRLADGILVDGISNERLYKNVFWLGPQCELLKYGSPRLDFLMKMKDDQTRIDSIRKRIGIDKDSYFVLYAPTFRSSGGFESFLLRFDRIQAAFESKYGKTTICVRFHPNTSRELSLKDRESFVFRDLSNYPDVDELVIASDCLITDYSSISYDYAYCKKPVFLYVKDIDDYLSTRGVYDVFNQLPFRHNTDEDMLIKDVLERDPLDYKRALGQFFNEFPTYNRGNAARRSADWLISKGLKEK